MTQELALPTMQAWTTPQPPLRWEDHVPLMRCLVLALLLHGLVIAIFGTAPGGSLREGDSLWGAIEVRLGGVGPSHKGLTSIGDGGSSGSPAAAGSSSVSDSSSQL